MGRHERPYQQTSDNVELFCNMHNLSLLVYVYILTLTQQTLLFESLLSRLARRRA